MVGGRLVEEVDQPRHAHAVGRLGDGQRPRHDLVGAVVVVAEGLAVGGGDHEPADLEGGVEDLPARRRLEGEGVGEAGVVDDEVDGAVGVVGVAPAVEAAARRLVGVDLAGGEDREADALLGEDARARSRSPPSPGSHMPSGRRPKRWVKSRIPHRTWVRTSRSLQSGRMAWP